MCICQTHLVPDNMIMWLSPLAWLSVLPYPSRGVLPEACFSNTNQPFQSLHLLSPPFSGSHSGQLHTSPTPRRARCETAKDSPYAPKSTEIIQSNQSQPAFPALPVPSCGNHDKAFCPQFFSFPLPPDPGASLCGPQCHDMYSLSWDLCVQWTIF